MIETIGEAWDQGVWIEVRCAWGKKQGLKTRRECVYGKALELETLVVTRGRDMPLAGLAERVRCPKCGSRRMRVFWTMPSEGGAVQAAAGR